MANVSHASLTGSQLHEPKGITSASNGTVYVADGAGSGSWQSVGTSAFTGMIADFVSPVAPTGWLELDGSTISTSTYAALYSVMTMQTSGTRVNGSPTITSIADTSQYVVGYYVFGTGIPSGTTITAINSGTQITLSNNATSSGTASFAVSPWLLNTGTIKLPDVKTNARYRRSRGPGVKVGDVLADQNQAHNHSSTVTSSASTDPGHFHVAGIYDPTHAHSTNAAANVGGSSTGGGGFAINAMSAATINAAATGVRINSSNGLDTTYTAGSHTHTITSTASVSTQGGTEARPVTLVVMTCVKT